MSNKVRLFEMGPRDGLQNEPRQLPVATRVELVQRLARAGLRDIEVGAFVSPKWVPQMAESASVIKATATGDAALVQRWALVPNLRGLEEAMLAGVTHVGVFTAASESFSKKNTNASIAESLERISEVMAVAKQQGVMVRGYVSCALGCPFEGVIAPKAVANVAVKLMEMGCDHVSIGDTIGTGTIASSKALLAELLSAVPATHLAAHLHDTYGQALANLTVFLDQGVRMVDSSIAGLGGCPYAPGATGNVATEDVARLCYGLGLDTGLELEKLAPVGSWISAVLSRPNQSRAGNAVLHRGAGTCSL